MNKSKLRTGIVFTTVLSVISLPLTYLRNWLLSLFGADVVADYAIILLLTNIISTFFLFGASTVYSIYLPKITETSKQINFILSSALVSGILLFFGLMLITFFPDILTLIISNNLNVSQSVFGIIFFIFIYGLGQIIMYSLIGLREYIISATINIFQPFIISLFLGTVFILGYNSFLLDDTFTKFIVLLSIIWLLNSFFGAKKIFASKKISFSWFLPSGFWKQSSFIHMGTVLTFAYGYIDQILVLGFLGKVELAIYFLTIQVARLVNFFSLRLQQVFQSSFAAVIKTKEEGSQMDLMKLYNEIAKYNLFVSFVISVFLIVFGNDIMMLFGKTMNFDHFYLSLLVFIFFIGSLGGIHSTIIQAKERNEIFFLNNIIVVLIQLVLSIVLVHEYKVLGVIIARLVSTIFGQIGLAFILRRDCNINFFSPIIFLSFITIIALIYFFIGFNISFILRVILFVLISLSSSILLKINIKKIWRRKVF